MTKQLLPIKRKAQDLRVKGLSYDKISESLGISKSTLHYWFLNLPPSPFQQNPELRRQHLAVIRPLATKAIRAKRAAWIGEVREKVSNELKGFSSNLFLKKTIVSFLYWAEGSKTTSQFTFTNSDPALCLLFLTLLRQAYNIEEEKIRIRLHLHHYHNASKTKDFWSKLLNVPTDQFEKTYIKSRKKTKKKRKNFAGICFIKYGKGGAKLQQEVLYFARLIQESISPCAHSSMDRT